MFLRPLLTKTLLSAFVVSAVFSLVFIPFATPVSALTLEEQLAQIEQDLAAIALNKQNLQSSINGQYNKIGEYSGEIGKLNGQVQAMQLDISQMDLQIKEVEVNIKILGKQITEKKVEIQTNEVYMVTLETESDARIQVNYMDYRIHKSNGVDFFTVKNANTYFKDSQYNEIIQDDTNQVLQDLSDLKLQMEKDKVDLEEKNVSVLRNKAILDEQRGQLDRKQADIKAQMSSYYSAINQAQSNVNYNQSSINQLSATEVQKLAERELVRQQLFNSYGSIPNGHYVLAGTIIGIQGATGYAFGEHVHFQLQVNNQWKDPCGYLPGSGGPGGCNGNGTLQWPLHGSFYYTSSFWDPRPWGYHYATDFQGYHGAPVYATHNGWLAKGVDQYGGLYIIICQDQWNCNSGIKTGYWHFSSY